MHRLRKCNKNSNTDYGLRTSKLGNYKEFYKWFIEQPLKDDEGTIDGSIDGSIDGVSDGVKPGFKLPNNTKTS